MRIAALLPLLALAGCGWFSSGPGAPAPEARPDHAACRREAENSPEARALGAQSMADNPVNAARVGPALEILVNRLYRDCLRRRGLAMPGGVESVRTR